MQLNTEFPQREQAKLERPHSPRPRSGEHSASLGRRGGKKTCEQKKACEGKERRPTGRAAGGEVPGDPGERRAARAGAGGERAGRCRPCEAMAMADGGGGAAEAARGQAKRSGAGPRRVFPERA